MCQEIHKIYRDDSYTHVRYKALKWLLDFAAKIKDGIVANGSGVRKETIETIVDLTNLPRRKPGTDAFEYLLKNRKYLFFVNDKLWNVIGACHCDVNEFICCMLCLIFIINFILFSFNTN